jgi:hypothetical protein
MFLFSKLPSAFFAGVRVREVDELHCITTVPYKWFSKNPFRSTYFACLSMAAEMTTGSLGLMQVYKRNPPVSLLVVKVDSSYYKKATGITKFICQDGPLFASAVDEAVETGEARQVTAYARGTNAAGEMVADFYITWSFRVRKNV